MSRSIPRRRLTALAALLSGALSCTATEVAEFLISGMIGDPDVTGEVVALLNGQGLGAQPFAVTVGGGMAYISTTNPAHNGRILYLNVPTKAGSYILQTERTGVSGEGTPPYVCVGGSTDVCGTGTITVRRAITRQEGEQRLLDLVVDFSGVTTSLGPLTGGVSACVDRHDAASCGPSYSGGTGSGSGSSGGGSSGGGNTACTNSFVVDSVLSIYSGNNLRPANRKTVTASGTRINVVGSSVPATGISLSSTELVSSTNPRYVVQLIIPNTLLAANRQLNFIAGQAQGVFVAQFRSNDGTIIPDTWRTDRDYGRNRDMGDLTISAVSPQIRGVFNFVATGDGYPTITNYFARINSGTFCVNP